MAPSNFTLRWESTGDKWWYACPIDWAAANGHYDLVRELLRIDGNHLINLTALRRIRRLEAVWDDEQQFDDVAKCRCEVAHHLYDECQSQEKDGKNSLIVSGYGGWLLYTAASAGDLCFVLEILEKYPLLVFGEGEYGLTDVLYAASRSKSHEVFRVVYDFAVSPRFLSKNGSEIEEHVEDVPMDFKKEIRNRAVHAAARGGNLIALKQLLDDCSDVLECRDVHRSTVLHAAAGKGQLEVVNHLIASYDMITSVDDKGNTPLHVAAYKGQLSVLEALIQASPSSASILNNNGDTFLHMAVAGFQSPGFRRLDQQTEFMKQLVSNKCFNLENVIDSKNNEGQTALHMAILGNVHSNLVELLMTTRYINLNVRDDHGMTPLDYLKRQPKSASSEILIRQLISAGGVSSCRDFAVRKAFASQLKVQGALGSPGTSFRVSDNELFFGTGMDRLLKLRLGHISAGHFRSISSISQCDSTNGAHFTPTVKKSGSLRNAAKRFKTIFWWSSKKKKETVHSRKMSREDFSDKIWSAPEETPVTLRERYSNANASSLSSNNKRTLAVRSNISSPSNRKKFAPGLAHDVLHDQLFANLSTQSPLGSGSFSPLPSPKFTEKGKGTCVEVVEHETTINDDDSPHVIRKQVSMTKRLINPALCFGGSRIGKHSNKQPVISVA
ncbi:hypothetical protein RND81_08G046100 [Saponaria officinalis]|uniref:Uncharacterized protein n=1 Tax=Saponaria officinalis TaxID=3572 RepID=A0AAW1J495_SAPOF